MPCPDPIYSDEAVVALCMNAMANNDAPIPDAGLRTYWNFSGDMCRAAVGGSLDAFLKSARNPTFSQLVDHESWSGQLGNRIPATQTRGALTTTMVTVQTNRGQERKFLWTLQQQRRPPDQGCWLVYECLYRYSVLLSKSVSRMYHTTHRSISTQVRRERDPEDAVVASAKCCVMSTRILVQLIPPPDARE